jgi:hypothetical protein
MPDLIDAPHYILEVELHFPNLASIAARAVQPVIIAQAPNLAIGLPPMCAVDAADPLRRFVVDWQAPQPLSWHSVKPEQYQNVWRPTPGVLHKGRVLSVPNICRSRRNPATARGGRHAMTGIRGPRRCERRRATNLNGSDTCRARQMPSAAAPARRRRVFVR